MRINNISITSCTALDFELNEVTPVTVFRGKHSTLALDLIRELLGEKDLKCDPDGIDDGRFIIHADVEIDNKNYSVCYIRNADCIGDNRIAANFKPNSIEFSEEDTMEFLEKRTTVSNDRPVFIDQSELEEADVTALIKSLAGKRQVFISISDEFPEIEHPNVINVAVS